MAIKKQIDLNCGTSIHYHRIESYTIDFRAKKAAIVCKGYTDETYREKEISVDSISEQLETAHIQYHEAESSQDTEKLELYAQTMTMLSETLSKVCNASFYVREETKTIDIENQLTINEIYKLLMDVEYTDAEEI